MLAAGAATRFGGGKLLAPWGEASVLAAALAIAHAAPARAVTLVTGADADRVAVEGRRAVGGRLRIVHAPDWAEGMAASLRAGAASLPANAGGAFIFLADMPRVPAAVLQPLADALAAGAPAAVPVWAGRRGHPALLGRGLLAQLASLTGDQGARRLLDALGPRLATVEAPDEGVLFDIDTPDDLARSRARPAKA